MLGSVKWQCFFLCAVASFAQTEGLQRHSITFSGEHARDVNGSSWGQTDTAVGLGVTYGYRLKPHLALDAGITTGLRPRPEIRGANYDYTPSDRFLWASFGLRAILPIRRDRFELSAGAGGLYERYSVSNPAPQFSIASYGGWGGYLTGGATVAVDRRHRFWLGASPHWFLSNAQFRRDRWFVITGDFTFRF
jgi:hypothetical protein